MDDMFEKELEEAQEDIQKGTEEEGRSSDIPQELQDDYDNLQSLVSIDPSIAESDEYKDLMAKMESYGQASDDEEEEEEEQEEEQEDEEEGSDEDSEDDEEEDEEEEEFLDIFGDTKKPKKAKKIKLDFEVPKEMESMLKSKYGIEDPSVFFSSVDAWRTQAQDGAGVKKDFEALSEDIRNLPPDIRKSINLWADGEDYKAPFINGERLNFGEDFEEQDIDSLVQHYLPEEYDRAMKAFNKEDGITEEELDSKLELLARTTKKLFTAEKKALSDERVQYEKRQEESLKKLKSSALDSVANLSKAYPNFSKAELSKIRNTLVEGRAEDLLYNSDGTYTAEAAERVAEMMYGKKIRASLSKRAERKGESKANQRIVDSSNKSVKKTKSANAKSGLNAKAVQHLASTFDVDPYE